MFSPAMGIALLLLSGAVTAFVLLRRRANQRPYCRDHRKFDPVEARRKPLLPIPKIDTTNVGPADPKIAALLAKVNLGRITTLLNELTGETDVTVNGKTVRIASRNTFSSDLEYAFAFLEAIYRSFGYKPRAGDPKNPKDGEAKPGEKFFYRHEYTRRRTKLYNFIAEQPGKNARKLLLVGSHIDSTAGATGSAEKLAPGADDDASGSIGVTEIARQMADCETEATIRYCHFSGEEQGLWGSEAYAADVAKEGLEVIGMLQMDMIGYCAKPGNRVDIHDDVDTNGSHSLVVLLVRNAVRYALKLNPVDTHNNAVTGRSDHAPFQDKGYKAVLISEEFSDDGFNPNYHSKRDRVPTLNLPWMVEVIRMVLATVVEMSKAKV